MTSAPSGAGEGRTRPSLLQLRSIRKSFGQIEVLHGVDFDLVEGEIHALVGHNGAGKSTLMKVIAGVFGDYGGSVRVEGREVALHSPKDAADNRISIIYQDFALVPDLSVADNVGLGREPRRLGGFLLAHRALRAQSAAELAEFGIDLPLNQPVRRLGVAGKQMTEIAKALAKRARVLIMDEPTARLAPGERTQLFAIMKRLAASGVGIIYISHFLDEVKEVADRVTVLRDGAVALSTPAAAISVEDMARELTGEPVATARVPAAPRAVRADAAPALQLRNFAVRGRPGIDLSVLQGEILGIAGLVGSGRTSLARAVIGDLKSGGEVLVDGVAVGGLAPREAAARGIVMVPEDRKTTGLVLQASVRANMELTALGPRFSRFGFVRRALRERAVREGIERFHLLPPDPNQAVGRLSGGNAQKVLLARAALAKPRIMLLDQPTAGVDIGAKAETHLQIRALAAEGAAVLLISDDLDEILDLSDRIAIMTGGVLAAPRKASTFDRSTLLAAISRNAERAV